MLQGKPNPIGQAGRTVCLSFEEKGHVQDVAREPSHGHVFVTHYRMECVMGLDVCAWLA